MCVRAFVHAVPLDAVRVRNACFRPWLQARPRRRHTKTNSLSVAPLTERLFGPARGSGPDALPGNRDGDALDRKVVVDALDQLPFGASAGAGVILRRKPQFRIAMGSRSSLSCFSCVLPMHCGLARMKFSPCREHGLTGRMQISASEAVAKFECHETKKELSA